jgi:cation:H+ antiporter
VHVDLFGDPFINLLILLGSLLVLDRACDLTVTSAVKISEIAGFGKTTVGFVVVAFCSSLPALSVSVIASLTGRIDIAVGNAIGSNLANVSLILGVCLMLAALRNVEKTGPHASMTKQEISTLYFGLFIGSAIPLALIYMGYANRIIGMGLLIVFVAYNYLLLKSRGNKKKLPSGAKPKQGLLRHASLAILGGTVIAVAAYFMVDSASSIAVSMHVDQAVIGGTVVAFGTSVSVLLASVRAVLRGHADVSLGNIIGTLFVNTTLILGASFAVWTPNADMAAYSSLFIFSVMANVFVWYFLSNNKTGWKEGVVLSLTYFIFLIISFGVYKP